MDLSNIVIDGKHSRAEEIDALLCAVKALPDGSIIIPEYSKAKAEFSIRPGWNGAFDRSLVVITGLADSEVERLRVKFNAPQGATNVSFEHDQSLYGHKILDFTYKDIHYTLRDCIPITHKSAIKS